MHRDEINPGKGDNGDVEPPWRDRTLLDRTYVEVSRAGMRGVTWYEIARILDVHHGHASGALSTLHKQKMLARLCETRGNCAVYVVGSAIGKRETVPYGGKPKQPEFFVEKLWDTLKREGVPRDINIHVQGYHLGIRFRLPETNEEVID